MEFDDALNALGVTRGLLTPGEKQSLDEQGFLILADILPPPTASRMLVEMQRIFDAEKTLQPGGPPECNQMQSKSDAFDLCLTHPRFLAAIWHVLGYRKFVAMGVNSRPNPPGKGEQPLHVDFGGPPCEPGNYVVCNSMWPLCEFTLLNGATRVVPGSHRWKQHPDQNTAKSHPQQMQVEVPLGSVVVFNSHLWHSAMLNRSTADRPNLTSFFSRRTDHAGKAVTNSLSADAWQRVGEPVRQLFDPPGGKQWHAY